MMHLTGRNEGYMARITPISWKRLRCVFEHDGFIFHPAKGDHWIGEKPGTARPIVIPAYHEEAWILFALTCEPQE